MSPFSEPGDRPSRATLTGLFVDFGAIATCLAELDAFFFGDQDPMPKAVEI